MAIQDNEESIATLNLLNIGLARSSKVLQSWASQKSVAQDSIEETDAFDEQEFKSATENSGISSKSAYAEDDAVADGSFQRKKLSSNEALSELLLGQKVANARKKSRAPGKDMSASRHAASKPLTRRPIATRDVDSEDEGEGRAAAFKSKQPRKGPQRAFKDVDKVDEDIDGQLDDVQSIVERPDDSEIDRLADSVAEPKPAKTKATSYLDEILAQKANKKSKKKKKDKTESKS